MLHTGVTRIVLSIVWSLIQLITNLNLIEYWKKNLWRHCFKRKIFSESTTCDYQLFSMLYHVSENNAGRKWWEWNWWVPSDSIISFVSNPAPVEVGFSNQYLFNGNFWGINLTHLNITPDMYTEALFGRRHFMMISWQFRQQILYPNYHIILKWWISSHERFTKRMLAW